MHLPGCLQGTGYFENIKSILMSTEIEQVLAQGLAILDRLQILHSDQNFQDEASLSNELSLLCNKLKTYPPEALKDHQSEINKLLDRLTENMSEASDSQMQIKHEMVSMRKKNIGAKTYLQNKLVKYL